MPTSLRILRGNPRRRPINDAEPQPEKVAPKRPKYFTGERRKHWNLLIKQLRTMSLLAKIDARLLERYVNWCAIAREAQEKLAEIGLAGKFMKAASGYVTVSAIVLLAKQADEAAHSCESELGIGPAARTRLRVEKPKEIDPFEAYRNSGKKRA